MDPKVSIIIPVYNEEKHLAQCLDSVSKQTYGDYEVLIVDDGSSDGTEEISKNYALNKKNVIRIRTDHRGVSHARNVGLEHARGEWIMFVDADDTIQKNCLAILVKGICKDAAMVIGGLRTYYQGRLTNRSDAKGIFAKTYSPKKIIAMNFYPKPFWPGSACAKLYRTEMIKCNHLRFDETISLIEDGLFNIEYLCGLDKRAKIRLTNYSVYNYNFRYNSKSRLLYQSFNVERISHFYSHVKMYKVLKAHHFHDPFILWNVKRYIYQSYHWMEEYCMYFKEPKYVDEMHHTLKEIINPVEYAIYKMFYMLKKR